MRDNSIAGPCCPEKLIEIKMLKLQLDQARMEIAILEPVKDFYMKEGNWKKSNKTLIAAINLSDVNTLRNKEINGIHYWSVDVGGKRAREADIRLKHMREDPMGYAFFQYSEKAANAHQMALEEFIIHPPNQFKEES